MVLENLHAAQSQPNPGARSIVKSMRVNVIIAWAAIALLIAIGGGFGFSALRAFDQQDASESKLESVHQVELTLHELLLVAMDALVDKNEGAIAPERLADIDRYVGALRSEVAALSADGGSSLEGIGSQALPALFATVETAITQDLRLAIAQRATPERLAAIDDEIDQAGERLQAAMETIVADAKNRALAAAEQARRTLYVMLAALGMAALAAGGWLGRRLRLAAQEIAAPIVQVQEAMSRLADGEQDVALPKSRLVEIGAMVEAIAVFRETARKAEALAQEQRQAQQAAAEEAAERARLQERLAAESARARKE
ncbi:MAG: hypothetical protein D6782_08340, partial [Alphaproteobacteria bacterium]